MRAKVSAQFDQEQGMNQKVSDATLERARELARQQLVVPGDSSKSVPASTATGLPPDIAAKDVTWDETLGSGQYAARRLVRDTVLRLTDIDGDACVQMLIYNANRTSERFNPPDTAKVPWQAYLGEHSMLLSEMGRVLMTVTKDTSQRHDTFCGASNRHDNDTKYGDGSLGGGRPNGRDLLALGAGKYALSRADVGPCVNFFKTARVGEDGSLNLIGDPKPGAYVELRCEVDVIVVAANTPHRLDDRADYTVSPVRLTARRATRPTPDPLRELSPERIRVFDNTAEHLSEVSR
jgi:uncharacterized protein